MQHVEESETADQRLSVEVSAIVIDADGTEHVLGVIARSEDEDSEKEES